MRCATSHVDVPLIDLSGFQNKGKTSKASEVGPELSGPVRKVPHRPAPPKIGNKEAANIESNHLIHAGLNYDIT